MNWADKILSFFFEWGTSLPLTLGDLTRNRFLRGLCALVMLGWAIPGLLAFGFIAIPLIFLSLFTDYVNGGC